MTIDHNDGWGKPQANSTQPSKDNDAGRSVPTAGEALAGSDMSGSIKAMLDDMPPALRDMIQDPNSSPEERLEGILAWKKERDVASNGDQGGGISSDRPTGGLPHWPKTAGAAASGNPGNGDPPSSSQNGEPDPKIERDKNGRFKKNTCGNPRGRPPLRSRSRSKRQMNRDILDVLEETVVIKIDRKPRRVSSFVASIQVLKQKGLAGDVKVIMEIHRLYAEALRENRHDGHNVHEILDALERHAFLVGEENLDDLTRSELEKARKKSRKF